MPSRTFIVLGEAGRLVSDLRHALPNARIIQARCLDLIPSLEDAQNVRVLVSQGAIQRCCLKQMGQWVDTSSTVYGEIGTFKCVVSTRNSQSSSKLAWIERTRVMSARGFNSKTREFITAAKEHDHEWFTVQEAADSLCLSVRQLRRIVEGEIGLAPHVLLQLVRICSVARTIEASTAPLITIAKAHRFVDLPSMSRQFKRFTGIPPGHYRLKAAE